MSQVRTIQPPVFLGRPDTIFGVCAAIGQDFGFNPDYLRVAVAVPVLFSPALAIGAYAALALLVLASRLLFPAPRLAIPADAAEEGPAMPEAVNDREDAPLAIAA